MSSAEFAQFLAKLNSVYIKHNPKPNLNPNPTPNQIDAYLSKMQLSASAQDDPHLRGVRQQSWFREHQPIITSRNNKG